ncbi:hypothetical protein BJY04DRAFT_203974 [Aspergillus karnatakaensis]|uniref:uncharacterized protein n=1 Tax=Aspergillus karnatakaensis TaxID=1810916 RepID=UPI003CCD3BC0
MVFGSKWPRLMALGLLSTGIFPEDTIAERLFHRPETSVITPVCPTIGYPGVSNQTDLNALAEFCTKIDGDLYINSNYTGPFVLNNVTNITGSIRVTDWYRDDPLSLTSFELPDLEHAGEIALPAFSSLDRLSLPKLKHVSQIALAIPAELDNLELPALTYLSTGRFHGDISRISFPSLQTVNFRLSIDNAIALPQHQYQTHTTMNISLPALETIPRLNIRGEVSALSVPNLTSMPFTGDPLDLKSELDFVTGRPISLAFPKLHHLDSDLVLSGNISSISLPSLRRIPSSTWDTERHGANQLTAGITIWSSGNLSLDLPIESMGWMDIGMNVSSVALPNLQNWSWISVDSVLPFNCSAFQGSFNETRERLEGDGYARNVTCSSLPESSASIAWSRGVVGVGSVVAGVVTLGVLLL